MAGTFSATVGDWANKIEGASEVIFKEACQELVEELDEMLVSLVYNAPISPSGYRRTGFLRASLMGSKSAMPQLSRANPGAAVTPDFGETVLVINSLDLGETMFLGYTANYGAIVHYGANGRQPRPWVDLVAQKWPIIVQTVAARVMSRLGL